MKKSREEILARRYCEYLGLSLDVTRRPDGRILAVKCRPTRTAGPAKYSSFKGFFFGTDDSYGMCEKLPDVFHDDNDAWNRINDMIIPASSPEELELQLSIRGF